MSNARQKFTDEEWDDMLKSLHFSLPKISFFNREEAIKRGLNIPKLLKPIDFTKGHKHSDNKAPMGMMLKQFPLALEAVAERSQYGHNKYKEADKDWMNFKRVSNPKEQYHNAAVRHLAEIGEDENSLEHLKAAAWNILATLQITLEKND